jgi:hypothetical protein
MYGFRPNPKQRVVNKVKQLFGRDTKVGVSGERPSPLDCARMGISAGTYNVTCVINGIQVLTANARNWRKAYDLLVIEVEKFYENTLHNTTSV